MSKLKIAIGVLLLGAASAVALLAFRSVTQQQAQAAVAIRTSLAEESAKQQAAQQQVLENKVTLAAAIKPLNSAVEDHVDGATLVDLFDSEDWWRLYRDEFALTRVIVGDALLASRGTLDLGTSDGDLVKIARKQRVASAVITIGGQRYIVGAARMPALPEREPVLVLAKLSPLPPPPEIPTSATPPAARFGDKPIPWVASGALGLVGLGLLVTSRKRGPTAPPGAVTSAVLKEPTLRFGTHMRPQPMDIPGQPARPPLATGQAISIPRATGVAGGLAPGMIPARITSNNPNPNPGTFGRYRLLDRLGEGGMSEVFTAETNGVEGFSRTFVLKRLRPELARDKEAVAQFIDEARMQSSLVHSNIVPVFDFGVVNGEYFMTQEYIAGRDIVRLMTRYHERTARTGLEPRMAYYIAHETLQALGYAHSRNDKTGSALGLVHRDVSAGNIIVSLQGEVKLADFGIVKSKSRVTQTQVGMVKGNANFMSPEQARGLEVDGRSDLFSLAMVLYYCLTNQLLYSGENDLDVLYKAATGPTLEDFSRIRELPDPAPMILEKALAFDPRERFQVAAEFAGVLAAHTGGGKNDAASLMHVLFGDEFKNEAA